MCMLFIFNIYNQLSFILLFTISAILLCQGHFFEHQTLHLEFLLNNLVHNFLFFIFASYLVPKIQKQPQRVYSTIPSVTLNEGYSDRKMISK